MITDPDPLWLLPNDEPTRIVLDGNIRYLRLLAILRAAGYDARLSDRGEVLTITERRLRLS